MGLVRTNNEDNFIVNADLSQNDWFIPNNAAETITLGEYGCLFVVADGMGGMNAGEVASAIAVESVKDMFSNTDLSEIVSDSIQIKNFLQAVVEKADKNIKDRVKSDPATEGMGTTIVIGWALNGAVYISWCGDSRAYLFNPNSGLVRLSKDHSYVQRLVDEGKLDPELAFDHPNSNVITRSLGDASSKALPDFTSRHLVVGDCILLCSDGLCGLCRDEDILNVFNESEDIEQCKNNLIASALDAGGDDNVTIVLFQVVTYSGAVNDEIGMRTHMDFCKKKNPYVVISKTFACIIILLIISLVILFTLMTIGYKGLMSVFVNLIQQFVTASK